MFLGIVFIAWILGVIACLLYYGLKKENRERRKREMDSYIKRYRLAHPDKFPNG